MRISIKSNKAGLILILVFLAVPSMAIDTEVVDSLLDRQIVLSGPKELHITNSVNAMVNSTVSLDHEDAWLFFDNIKPSLVKANYLQYVQVNGSAFSDGVNGRVAIYAHGTVLMPHASAYKPLKVYTGEDFGGDSLALSIHTYHNDLGSFEAAIRSFRLKRGYMASFATNADGTGYSRVFIADNEDIELSVMPAELNATVAFIRVFKHQWVTKKGKAGWNPNDINATCYYDWSAGGSSSADVEYTPIRQNGGWPSWTDINGKQNVSHLLGFNEPDRPDQANMTFQAMIDLWPGMMQSGLRIGSPAWSDAWNTTPGGNLFDFINTCDELNYRVDFVALHCYWGGKSPGNWYNDLKYIHEATGRPLWITEWNNGANWTNEWWPDADRSYTEANAQKQLNDLKGILQVLDTARFVERYFIYDWVQDCRAMVLDGELTLAGEYYAANPSRIAFDRRNEVIPGRWVYDAPQLSYRYLSLSKKISLSWEDPNGNLSRSVRVEKRVNNGNYEAIFESDDPLVSACTDDLDSSINGRISYRASIETVYGDYVPSNEVSYYQSQGNDSIQFGKFPVDNTDWATYLFSTELKEKPVIITGIPTLNTVIALTHRVNAATTRSFKFRLDAWEYLNNPALTKIENIAIAALPAGVYDLGGLKAIATEVSNVSADWITVAFDQSFDTVPVVFCTQVSNSTSFPTMPAIRNITGSGFELCLRCEEDIPASSIFPETVNYLALEPGRGAIGMNRILVGQTGENEEGISSTPVVLDYDSSYSRPLLFASMLSSSDNFASTLRYYSSGDHEFTILKQRELSGQITAIKEDKLGWMVMDIAPDQPVNIEETMTERGIHFYPNPAGDYIYINVQVPTRIEIYDLSGRKQMEKRVSSQALRVDGLPAGIYLLKAEGYLPVKFIKR